MNITVFGGLVNKSKNEVDPTNNLPAWLPASRSHWQWGELGIHNIRKLAAV